MSEQEANVTAGLSAERLADIRAALHNPDLWSLLFEYDTDLTVESMAGLLAEHGRLTAALAASQAREAKALEIVRMVGAAPDGLFVQPGAGIAPGWPAVGVHPTWRDKARAVLASIEGEA